MTILDWERFAQLPGAPDANFERLCRSLMRRHYAQFGSFRGLANQAGVEFHLQLSEECDLGGPPRWYGWQCKWYDLRNGQSLGATRRAKIVEGLRKTKKHVPGITDWVLWTKHTLTKSDQTWFYDLSSQFPGVKLALADESDIHGFLTGPATSLRATYFGELIVTGSDLQEQRRLAIAPFRSRFQSELHCAVPVESALRRSIGEPDAWAGLDELLEALASSAATLHAAFGDTPSTLTRDLHALHTDVGDCIGVVTGVVEALRRGDWTTLVSLFERGVGNPTRHRRLLARLRSARSGASIAAANAVADLHLARCYLEELIHLTEQRTVAVFAEAGAGKSELAVAITQATVTQPAGVVFFGKDLHRGHDLDDLAQSFKLFGVGVPTFELLVEALDAAGQRAGRRIPVVIDGLNEAEDPRDWKAALARADELLRNYPFVMLIVTLRGSFAEDCIPTDIPSLELKGFEDDPIAAVRRYFKFYKIDATDADLPMELLHHPLTLRIYCEVANSVRKHVVGIEALPRSLTGLFESYFSSAAQRVAQQSPATQRVYSSEVEDALVALADRLWVTNARELSVADARQVFKDSAEWSGSLLRSLESEGILVRTTDERGNFGVSFTYDLMAGHMIARALLRREDLEQWLAVPGNTAALTERSEDSHPLGGDTFRALAGLFPARSRRRLQLWQVVSGAAQSRALLLTTKSDPASISRETVERFGERVRGDTAFAFAAYEQLQVCRAAHAHPYDVSFLDLTLREMRNAERDTSWSEWLRLHEDDVRRDLTNLEKRWAAGVQGEREGARARWVMWTLTTTNRYLRDLATRALYTFARVMPHQFGVLALDALSVTDPYVPERTLAAAYGASLSAWACGPSDDGARALCALARRLFEQVFKPGARHATQHTLLRQYCLGVIESAQRNNASLLSITEQEVLNSSFERMPSPFDGLSYDTDEVARADDSAIRMDFGNYTIGRLVSRRANYDFGHADYVDVRRRIVERMLDLGYDPAKFAAADLSIARREDSSRDARKVDRYGKKYALIAYLEMWGLRQARGLLPEYRAGERVSDVGIDPTFPRAPREWSPRLPDLFSRAPSDLREWMSSSVSPDYAGLLCPATVEAETGEWVLLDGYVQETAPADDREIFSFLRGLLVAESDVQHLLRWTNEVDYPGNDALPRIPELYYTFAGEMPFRQTCGLRDFSHEYSCDMRLGNRTIRARPTVRDYAWESYHSRLNEAGGASFPSLEICEALGLWYSGDDADLMDCKGKASLFRRIAADHGHINGRAAYLRADLLRRYLDQSKQKLVWIVWGERGQRYRRRASHDPSLERIYQAHLHIHKRALVWS